MVLSPRRSIVGALVVALICLLALVLVLVHDGPRQALLAFPWTAVLALATAWGWAWPRTVLGEHDVTARNHLRTLRIPWSDLEDVDARLGLVVVARGHRYPLACPTRRRSRRTKVPAVPVVPAARDQVLDIDVATAARLLIDARRALAGDTTRGASAGDRTSTAPPMGGLEVGWDLRPSSMVLICAAAALSTLPLM